MIRSTSFHACSSAGPHIVSVMSVRTRPGLTSSRVTPVPSRAAASESVSRDSPAFDTAYADHSACGRWPMPLPTCSTRPDPRATIAGSTSWASRNGPRRLVSTTRHQSSGSACPGVRRGPLAESRVAHQQVDGAEVAGHGVDRGPHLVPPRDVGGHRHGAAAGPGDLAEHGVQTGAAAAEQADRGAVPGEGEGDLAPDAPPRTGDERHLPRQPHAAQSSAPQFMIVRDVPWPTRGACCPRTSRTIIRVVRPGGAARGGAAGWHGGQLRWTAPVRRAASATAASRAALASSAVSVRSGARKRSA